MTVGFMMGNQGMVGSMLHIMNLVLFIVDSGVVSSSGCAMGQVVVLC